MRTHTKREQILDAMQQLMNESSNRDISISDIAKKAGIGKGSIYYYFDSKNDMIEAVIEHTYSVAIEKSKQLASLPDMDACSKMELIFQACLDASRELKRQEQSSSYMEIQQSSLTHQRFISFLIKNFKPILADIFRQGIKEGTIQCEYPDQIAEIVLIVLTVKLDNHIIPSTSEEIKTFLHAFSLMQSKSMDIQVDSLKFLQY